MIGNGRRSGRHDGEDAHNRRSALCETGWKFRLIWWALQDSKLQLIESQVALRAPGKDVEQRTSPDTTIGSITTDHRH
jgi:hypothetical protein